jgi:ring-1,2-phenylacetyl-CoA epoxidase subunit PaaB
MTAADAESSAPVWEVFVQPKPGEPYQHAGSLHAPDAEMALQNARDVYARRGPVAGIWVVANEAIIASQPEDRASFFDPGPDKVYRLPGFYSRRRKAE